MHPNACPIRNPSVIKQQVAETTVLLDVVRGSQFTIQGVGGRIWDLCDGQHSLADMALLLHREVERAARRIQLRKRTGVQLVGERIAIGIVF